MRPLKFNLLFGNVCSWTQYKNILCNASSAPVYHRYINSLRATWMDSLDKKTITAIIALVVSLTLLFLLQGNKVQSEDLSAEPRIEKRIYSPGLEKKIKVATDLLASNSVEKAELLINGLISEYPYEGQPYMLLGDLHLYRQNILQAMLAYKEAISYNPDFLDKKTPLFQGKKIKNTVKEARVYLGEQLAQNPGDKQLKEYKKTIYYMLRKIAGSCG
jgi:tetratricopeptide (TPR) repeat protein